MYERDLEVFESIFAEKGMRAHSYLCCLLIVLKQRDSYGIDNIGQKYIKTVLLTYEEASSKKYKQSFDAFAGYFKALLIEAGKISLCCYIHVKMQFYLSIYYKHHGKPEKSCKASVRYLNKRLRHGMYSHTEEIIAETVVAALNAVEMVYLKQAQHMLNAASALAEQLDGSNPDSRFQRTGRQESRASEPLS